MLDKITILVVAVFIFVTGLVSGKEQGWREVHAKEVACQTLPTNVIHCWYTNEITEIPKESK